MALKRQWNVRFVFPGDSRDLPGFEELNRWDLAGAEAAARKALEDSMGTDGPCWEEALPALDGLAAALLTAGRHAEADDVLSEALGASIAILGHGHNHTHDRLLMLGVASLYQGLDREALGCFAAVASFRKETFGPDHPATLQARDLLAVSLAEGGRLDEATALFGEVVAGFGRVPPHLNREPHFSAARNNASLAESLRGEGAAPPAGGAAGPEDFPGAREAGGTGEALEAGQAGGIGEALDAVQAGGAGEPWAVGKAWERRFFFMLENPAEVAGGPDPARDMRAIGDLRGAEAAARKALSRRRRKGSPGREAEELTLLDSLGLTLVMGDRHAEAVRYLEEAVSLSERTLGHDDELTLCRRGCLGLALAMSGRVGEGLDHLMSLLEYRLARRGPGDRMTLAVRTNIGIVLAHDVGRLDQAVEIFREIQAATDRLVPPDRDALVMARDNLELAVAIRSGLARSRRAES
ncbi:MAG: tetratricopeptide repeat protein [Deltaproteobacteria bacterium]|jgi:tetratricopeptide (TPR) repeat protein|nr:tetratricopeptide repeat protein [Deltaproteobacteria bacterium]